MELVGISDLEYDILDCQPEGDPTLKKEIHDNDDVCRFTEENIQLKIKDMANSMKSLSFVHIRDEKPPYLSLIYGQARKKHYEELLGYMKGHPPEKQSQHKVLFYKEVDLAFQQAFEEAFCMRKKYEEHINSKNFKASAFNLKESLNLACVSNSDLDLLRSEVMELSLDWYVWIDRAVDVLVRCNLYGIYKEVSYNTLYMKIKTRYCLDKPQTWSEWLYSYWKSSMKFLQRYFEMKAIYREAEEEDVSLSDLLTYVTCIACEQILSVYKNEIDHEAQKKNLQKIRDFLQRSIQNLELLVSLLSFQIEDCLLASTKIESEEKNKDLEMLISCLLEFEKDVLLLNLDHISRIRKSKKAFVNSTGKLNEISLVKSTYIPNNSK